MKAIESERGFIHIVHPLYVNQLDARVISESSAIGDYKDSDQPGSSYLWVGDGHHLNREEVQELIKLMQHWLDHKRLPQTLDF